MLFSIAWLMLLLPSALCEREEVELPVLRLTPKSNEVYDLEVAIGKPAQKVGLRLDIANAPLWVPNNADFPNCTTKVLEITTTVSGKSSQKTTYASTTTIASSDDDCPSNGLYNVGSSNSGHYFNMSSVEQSSADTNYGTNSSDIVYSSNFTNYITIMGELVEDTLSFEDSENTKYTLPDFVFVSANESDVYSGGLGLGADSSEVDTFLGSMVSAGYINSSSYSLSLNGINATYAELLLGGLDSDRFAGPFAQFDFIPIQDDSMTIVQAGYSSAYPVLPLTGLGVTSSSGKTLLFNEYFSDGINQLSFPRPALLDSRYLYNFLPYSLVIDIAVQLNAYFSSDLEAWLVMCKVGDSGFLDFHFGNMTIMVPLQELLYDAYDTNGTRLRFQNGEPACALSILPDYYSGFTALGTPFLRSVYLAVDNENLRLAMGQANPQYIKDAASADYPSSYFPSCVKNYTTRAHTRTTMAAVDSSIPFASPNNVTSYDSLVLTVDTLYARGSGVSGLGAQTAFISNGEVIVGRSTSIFNGSASLASDSYTKTSKGAAASVVPRFYKDSSWKSALWLQLALCFTFIYAVVML